jgi:hypothetical protein
VAPASGYARPPWSPAPLVQQPQQGPPAHATGPAQAVTPVQAVAQPQPQTMLVALPYPAYGGQQQQQQPYAQPAAAAALKQPVTMLDRMRGVFVGAPAAPAQPPAAAAPVPTMQLVQVAGLPGSQQLVAVPVNPAAVAYYTKGATAAAAVPQSPVAQPQPQPQPQPAPAAVAQQQQQQQQQPQQPPAPPIAQANNWPPAHNSGEASDANKGPRPVMTNSPAIRLAARPELAALTVGQTAAPAAAAAAQPAAAKKPDPSGWPEEAPVMTAVTPRDPPRFMKTLRGAYADLARSVRSDTPSGGAAAAGAGRKTPTGAEPPDGGPELATVEAAPRQADVPRRAAQQQMPKAQTPFPLKVEGPKKGEEAKGGMPVVQTAASSGTGNNNNNGPQLANSGQGHAHLKEVVETACGKLARAVRVESGQDGRDVVHVTAAPSAEDQVIGKLLAVPEIAASNIKLQIHLSSN